MGGAGNRPPTVYFMKLQATQPILIPEGQFFSGDIFETSAEIGQRLIEKGHAHLPTDTIATRDPVVEIREPAAGKRKRR